MEICIWAWNKKAIDCESNTWKWLPNSSKLPITWRQWRTVNSEWYANIWFAQVFREYRKNEWRANPSSSQTSIQHATLDRQNIELMGYHSSDLAPADFFILIISKTSYMVKHFRHPKKPMRWKKILRKLVQKLAKIYWFQRRIFWKKIKQRSIQTFVILLLGQKYT